VRWSKDWGSWNRRAHISSKQHGNPGSVDTHPAALLQIPPKPSSGVLSRGLAGRGTIEKKLGLQNLPGGAPKTVKTVILVQQK